MTNKLELLIRKTGRKLREYQVASIHKIPEEFQQTPCDFFGYTAIGRAILVEAKMLNRLSLPLGKSPGLSGHQWVSLCEANKAGCLALIVWQKGEWIATISIDMAWKLSEKRRSIPWKEIPAQFKHWAGVNVWRELFSPFLCVPPLLAKEA